MSDNQPTGPEPSRNDARDQRIEMLEEQVQQLTEKVDQQRDGGLPDVTRRQALGGLMGGGALLGAAGAASAESDDENEEEGEHGPPFAYDHHDHSGDVLGEGTPVEAIRTGELNNAHYIEPDVDDWGAAVNDALTEMEQGGVLFIPPARYDTKTKAVIDKEIQLVGMGWGSGYTYTKSEPAIVKQADVPILEAAGANESKGPGSIRCRVRGLRFESAVDDTTPGAIFHGTVEASNIVGENLGSHVMLLQQVDGLDDNLNDSIVRNVSKNRGTGSVVRIENVSDAGPNVNAMDIRVNNSFRNEGWGIDAADGFGNFYSVQVMHGAANGFTGGIRMNTEDSYGRVTYIEGDADTGIQFDGKNNTGQIIRGITVLEGDEFVDNTGRNRHINYGDVNQPDVTKPAVPYNIQGGASILDGNAEIIGADNGLVLTAPSGVRQYKVTVDSSGNLVTEEVQSGDYQMPKESLTIDGNVSELSAVPGLSLKKDFRMERPDPTASGTVWVTWDGSYFYLAADVEDDQHKQPETGLAAIYEGDVLQMGVAPSTAGQGDSFTQFNAALTPKGPQVTKERWPDDGYLGPIDVPAEIVRNDGTNHTRYEVALPWEQLPTDPTPAALKLCLGLRDVDPDGSGKFGRVGYYEWGDGIISGKDVTGFKDVVLVEK